MTVNKEAILKKAYEGKLYSCPGDDEIRQAMDEYAASLLKENEELKKDLTSYKESFENNKEQFMELAAHAKDLEIEIAELKNGLAQAIEVIKSWHNADEVWDIYFNNAPEMKIIRQITSKNQ